MTDEKNRLSAWLAELERILAPLLPVASPRGCVDPDFRRMVIPSPSPATVEAAIDAVKDYAIRLELTERARRLERDLTDFDCNKRRFHEECRDMGTARERQASGKLSDAPEALRQLRRNLKGDIARLKELIDVAEKGQADARQSGGQGGTLACIEKKLDETYEIAKRGADAAERAATRRYKQLKKQSDAGRRGAELAKATGWTDPKRKAAITEARRRIACGEKPDSVYADLAGSWTTPQGNPISADGVKKAVQRAGKEKRGNRSQKGKTRGQYRTIGHTNR